MKQYTFKDGIKVIASTKQGAIRKHKVLASARVVADSEENNLLLIRFGIDSDTYNEEKEDLIKKFLVELAKNGKSHDCTITPKYYRLKNEILNVVCETSDLQRAISDAKYMIGDMYDEFDKADIYINKSSAGAMPDPSQISSYKEIKSSNGKIDGVRMAACANEAIAKHKATSATKVVSAQEEGQCFVLVPKDMLVNRNLILRCKKLWIKDARTVGVQEGLKHSKPARTLDRMIKLISEDM